MISALVVPALVMGLLGSTHCVVMCGGVASVLSSGVVPLGTSARDARARRARRTLAYNAGRVASYGAAGAIAGAFGALVDRVPVLYGAELGLRLVAGVVMVGLGLHLAGAWRRFAAIERVGAPVWRRVEPIARRLLPARSVAAALALGALWGWMPCGLVYAALGLALGTGSAPEGALTMIAFGVGTLPTLLTLGAVAARVTAAVRTTWARRAAGIAIVLLGVFHVAGASAQIGDKGAGAASHTCCTGHHGGSR